MLNQGQVNDFIRHYLRKLLTNEDRVVLVKRLPSLADRFQEVDAVGLYLHIPFCRQICPYCPYNKELYHPGTAEAYTKAVLREIDVYAEFVGSRPVTSLYIGGGTPSTMLYTGLKEILSHIQQSFNMQCEIHMESHPNDLSEHNIETIQALGVSHLSIGVEALQDRHLRVLQRPYSTSQVKAAVARAVAKGFKCVNADFIFALPGQTYREVAQAGRDLVETGVDQVAAYPLFKFPYTRWVQIASENGYHRQTVFTRRKMLRILEEIFYAAGFERTSVWAFTRKGVPKYCSVTVPLYVGLGASGGSYLRDIFYLNTFNVSEYIQAINAGRLPVALSVELSEKMQMAGWLYWRIYETRFKKSAFRGRFGRDFDDVYGGYIRVLSGAGLLKEKGDEIVLTDRGAYWLHVVQDLFSIDYISKLWGTSKQNPWPEKVVL